MDTAAQPQISHVKITNNNPFEIKDRYDNIPYAFPPGKPVSIPLGAARHIFGFHLESGEREVFDYMSRRFGWNKPGQDEEARLYFSNMEIKPIAYRLVEVGSPDDKPDPKAVELNLEAERVRPGRKRSEPKPVEEADAEFGEER